VDSKNKKLVIFDFDGVLANTLEFSYKIHKDVNGALTWEKFQSFGMGNFHEKLEKFTKEESYIAPKNFYELYKEKISLISIHDILRETILQLKDQFKLVIVSSTFSSYISDFLKKEKLLEYFSEILGADVHKSKTVKINNILKKYDTSPKDAVLITDTLGDILEAKNCNVPSIAVTWGLHERKVLEEGNPIKIIDEPQDLIKAVQEILC
jgi:phosphoglycolate phosphatase